MNDLSQELVVIDLKHHHDERGVFYELWKNVPEMNIKQANISRSKKGVIRGIHAEPWDKYIHVVEGKILVVAVDLRKGSTSFGKHFSVELDNTKALLIPQGFGNSFQALEDTIYAYMVTGIWDGQTYPAVAYDDKDLAIEWPIKDAILSSKDRNNKSLKDYFL